MENADYIEKEVYFTYCETCKHKELADTECPCFECLDSPTNMLSHKPVKWEEKGE